ncbi:hypothetical protein [Acetivibrio cellulolyticus]|uniref:hypothetical protein n=1 Tax=Acetivibrio cellulolyticus TaxID=35830 RepID=UPI0001E2FBCB|nr:hypothetical protein [Acetivibrio cellulolyticus]
MIFKGISKRFVTIDNQQYEEIGDYWDYFAKLFGRENLLGLGLNWKEDSLEYVIGTVDDSLKFDIEQVKDVYPDCKYKEIDLPEDEWKTYDGRTEELSKLYDAIYKEGVLLYEIESFRDDGNCRIRIRR